MATIDYKKWHAEHHLPKIDWSVSSKMMQLQEAVERELVKIELKLANEAKWRGLK